MKNKCKDHEVVGKADMSRLQSIFNVAVLNYNIIIWNIYVNYLQEL